MATSFVPVPENCDFPLENLPWGIFSTSDEPSPRAATAIGEHVVDLRILAENGLFSGPLLCDKARVVFSQPTLNAFMALGRPAWREARVTLLTLLCAASPTLRDNSDLRAKAIIPMAKCSLHLPVAIGDYTDFYASKEHATNVGTMFRGKDNALMPNWVHIPVGYHGRASSIVVSGTPIKRPHGQIQPEKTKPPVFEKSRKLDFELEMAFVVGVGNELGTCVTTSHAEEHIFGIVVMNDWSARDIQAFEYVPLGPFLGKSFGTTVSPWIVSLDALAPFRCATPAQTPTPASYLTHATPQDAYDVKLEVQLRPSTSTNYSTISKSNFKYMYWSVFQQLAHHTVNGCNMRTGDLCGSGTISGPTEDSYGSILELTWNGTKSLSFPDGTERKFIEDGDELKLKGWCEGLVNGKTVRIGFGDCTGVIVKADD